MSAPDRDPAFPHLPLALAALVALLTALAPPEDVERSSQTRYLAAVRSAEQQVRDHAADARSWIALARLHLDPGWLYRRPARAESALRRALQLAGRQPELVAMFAQALHEQAKESDALAAIAEVVDVQPLAVDAPLQADLLVTRAEILLHEPGGDAAARSRAFADLARAIACDGLGFRARLVRAEALRDDGRFDAALADLAVAVGVRPGSREVHYSLFLCHRALGEADAAMRDYEIWRRLNRLTDSVSAHNQPDAQESLKLLRELKQLNPHDFARRIELADRELELGAPHAALRECDELIACGCTAGRLTSLRALAVRRLAATGSPAPGASGGGGMAP